MLVSGGWRVFCSGATRGSARGANEKEEWQKLGGEDELIYVSRSAGGKVVNLDAARLAAGR